MMIVNRGQEGLACCRLDARAVRGRRSRSPADDCRGRHRLRHATTTTSGYQASEQRAASSEQRAASSEQRAAGVTRGPNGQAEEAPDVARPRIGGPRPPIPRLADSLKPQTYIPFAFRLCVCTLCLCEEGTRPVEGGNSKSIEPNSVPSDAEFDISSLFLSRSRSAVSQDELR